MKKSPCIMSIFVLLSQTSPGLCVTAPPTRSVTLAWDPSPSPNLAGNRIYYGTTSRNYTNIISPGNVTSATIPGLVVGARYYFAATTYDSAGVESTFSTEIGYTIPAPPPQGPQLNISASATGLVTLAITGQIGHVYEIQATQNLTNWNTIGTVAADAIGQVRFIDVNSPKINARFYRTHDL